MTLNEWSVLAGCIARSGAVRQGIHDFGTVFDGHVIAEVASCR